MPVCRLQNKNDHRENKKRKQCVNVCWTNYWSDTKAAVTQKGRCNLFRNKTSESRRRRRRSTELQQIAVFTRLQIYTGKTVLKGILGDTLFVHFMTFSIALGLLLSLVLAVAVLSDDLLHCKNKRAIWRSHYLSLETGSNQNNVKVTGKRERERYSV